MVNTEIDSSTGNGTIVLKPNCSSSWRFNLLVAGSLGFIMFIISMIFLLQGLWLILPFSGLEFGALIWGLYYVLRNSVLTEVIIFDDDRVVIERGHRRAENQWEYKRAWSKIFVKPPQHRGYPKRVFIRSSGKELELGSFLNAEDREKLIQDLKHLVYT